MQGALRKRLPRRGGNWNNNSNAGRAAQRAAFNGTLRSNAAAVTSSYAGLFAFEAPRRRQASLPGMETR